VFLSERLDVAVVEVGLGGRLDATNVVAPVVCGISSLGLDHTNVPPPPSTLLPTTHPTVLAGRTWTPSSLARRVTSSSQ